MKKAFLYNNFVFFLISFLSIMFLFFGYKSLAQKTTLKELYEDFTIYVNNEKQIETNLKEFELDKKLNQGEILAVEKTLTNLENNTIAIYSRHASLKVYENNELIYEYTKDLHRKHKTVDGKYHLVELTNSNSSTVKIEHIIATSGTVDSVKPLYIDSTLNIIKNLFNKNFVNLLLSTSLSIIGILMLIISLFIKTTKANKNTIVSLGFFVISTSIWSLCESGLLPLFLKTNIPYKTLENISFFCLIIPFSSYVYTILDKKIKEKKYFKIIAFIATFFNIIVFTIDFLDIYSARNLLTFMHALIIITIFLTMKICMKYKNIQTKYLSMGLIYLVITVFTNLIFFYTNDIIKEFISINLTTVGIFIFTTIILFGYFKNLLIDSAKAKESEFLAKIAYQDALTGLYNRAKYEKDLDDFKPNDICGIIFYDLNKLKIINDTLGHKKGDELITNFTDILKQESSNFGVNTYRLGGDEFVVIFKNKEKQFMEDFASRIEQVITYKNKTNELQISVSYGAAISNEESKLLKVRDIVKLADERMYLNKLEKRKKEEED